jgi:anti-sigma-K factor RskA
LAALVILFAAVAGWSFFRAEQAEREGATDRRVAADLAAAEDGIALTGAGEAGGRIIPIEGGSRMVAAGLSHPGSGSTYQLWLVREDGDIESAGTFSVAGGLAVLTLSESMVTFRSALVTIEPEGGSPQPTTDAVIAGPGL